MNPEQQSAPAESRGVSTVAVEGVVAVLVLGLGLLVLFGSRKLGSGWTTDGPGAGYFPFYIGLILCISGAGIFWQTVFGKQRKDEVFVDNVQLRRVLTVLVPALVYVLAVMFVGIYIASAVYIACFMVFLGKYSALRSIVAAVAISALLFTLFEIWFKVPLAKGSLNPLGFLGY